MGIAFPVRSSGGEMSVVLPPSTSASSTAAGLLPCPVTKHLVPVGDRSSSGWTGPGVIDSICELQPQAHMPVGEAPAAADPPPEHAMAPEHMAEKPRALPPQALLPRAWLAGCRVWLGAAFCPVAALRFSPPGEPIEPQPRPPFFT